MVRSKNDIIKDILVEAGPKGIENKEIEYNIHGATKTRIMNSCGLSLRQASEYLPFLVDRKLLDKDKYFGIYVTTEKGLAFLDNLSNVKQLSTK